MVGDNRSEADALARNPSRLEQMSLYSKYVLPRVIDLTMQNPETRRLREVWIPQAEGEVLEVGIGSGLNLELYTQRVSQVHGVDPLSNYSGWPGKGREGSMLNSFYSPSRIHCRCRAAAWTR